MGALEKPVLLLAVILLAATVYAEQTFTNDPCDAKEYKVLNETHRSTGFLTAAPETPLCDDRLRRGWYRFISKAGGEMPTTCQETNRCGTTKPIWLDGTNPAVTDGISMRRICANLNNSDPNPCCQYSEEIFMKNCGGFFVYYLYPTIECDMAYCAGNIPPCPVGKWSITGFHPCLDNFPVLEDPPVVTGPDINTNASFGFECHVKYDQDNQDQRFSIVWTFNDVPDTSIPPMVLRGNERTAFLDISFLKSHPDTNVACQVQSYFLGREQYKSGFLTSNSTFFGMQTPPVLTGPIMPDEKSFIFQCNITIDNNNPYQEFEVLWTFDGQPDPSLPPQTMTSFNETAVLDGAHLKGHLNTKIGCEARLIYPESGVKTAYLKSNTYLAGVKMTPNPLEMSEIDFEKYVTVTSTIPIICDFGQDCCLTFRLNFNETSAVSLLNTCEHKMCSSHWKPLLNEASIQIGVVPTRNILVEGIKGVFLSFEVVVPTGSLDYLQIFQDFRPDRLQITIKDESAFTCSLTGDPHIIGFEFKFIYDLYKSGDFIIYVAERRDFMIQVRTVPCGGGAVACICGIAVRERNDVIKVSKCNNPNYGPTSIDIAYTLSPGTIVQRSTDGYRFGIYLPSGSEVKIDAGGTNVYISIPAFDKGFGRGICGTNDGDKDNDFTHPDGKVDPPCSGRCIPDAFLESWRVTQNESLFEVVPDPVTTTDPIYGSSTQYCSCLEKSSGKTNVSCSTRQHVQVANTACPNCPVITDLLKPSYVVGIGWVPPGSNKPEEPFVHPEVKPVDTNKQWPNDQGVTEAQARDICTKAIQKSQLYPQCQNFQHITSSVISDCLSDILFGGTTEFLDDVTSAFTAQCQIKLAQNPDNYVTNANGDQVMKPDLLDNICPIECMKHGKCGEKGLCLCQDGWEGDTCLIESGKGPQLVEIKGGPFCDITQQACDVVNIDITNINFMDQLLYRIQSVDEQGFAIDAPNITMAIFLSPGTITCKLPSVAQSVQRYNISASKDGTLFGNEVTVTVFDGTCLNCDSSGCKEKNTACHINNVCYKNGEDDPKDGNRTCNIHKSTSRWSTKRGDQDRFPKLDTPPNVFGPKFLINGSVIFECDVIYDHDDPEQVFEVVWTFNGQSDPSIPVDLLFGHERSTNLDISYLAGHADQNVGCQVRSYYVDYDTDKSAFITSNTIYFGIRTPPVLEGPILPDNKSYIFQCEIIYNSFDSSQEIEVTWTFDDQLDPALPPQIISDHNQSLDLNGTLLLGHLGTKVGCQARLVFSGSNVKTGFVKSNKYFVGIQITPDPLQMSEIDFVKNVTVTSTIPIICDHDLDCCLTFKLNANSASGGVSLLNSCEHRMCSSDWDPYLKRASIQIGVAPKRNILVEGSRSMSLAFAIISPSDTYLQVFQNYYPNSVQIIVTDETSFKCSLTGDPHIMGFDIKYMYDLYKSGDFIAYVASERDFMIQVRTVPCGGGSVACICGIAVRERNDVIKVDKCNNPNSGQAAINIAYKLSQGTIIQMSTDGYRFGIYLQSGSEVKIEAGGTNVYISIPAFDKGLGRGICGTNDGVEDNDFTYPDGRVEPTCTTRCIPDKFLESWRVTRNESLFEVVPDPVNTTDLANGTSTQYCSCQDMSDGNSTMTCSARQHMQMTNTACPGCPVITNILIPSYVVGTGWVNPGSNKPEEPFVHPEVKPVDTNKQWPNDQGVTESQARQICTTAMQKSQLYTQCQNFHQLTTSVMSDCLSDILFGGTTQFLDDITQAFTTHCQQTLAKNPDNYVTNTDGDHVMNPDLLDHICPIECLNHGQCGDKGLCLCQDGWEGDTCLIESGKGPQLVEIKGGPLCDNSQRSCHSINIDITNINFLDELQIKLRVVDEQGNIIDVTFYTGASFLSPTTITFLLPVLDQSTKRFNISATKDGTIFGNELQFRVFDSTCLDCDLTACKEKNTACRINNICYKNGEDNPNDRNKTCDATKSTSRWTTKRSQQDHFPILVTQPIVTGPNIDVNGSASFQCNVIYDLDDPEQIFEVNWIFNGQSDSSIPTMLLHGNERNATLNIALLRYEVNKYVGCRVRAFYVGYETNKSPYITGNSVFFGIKVPPLLRGPVLTFNKSFSFHCEVFYDNGDSSQEIEVVWTFDGREDSSLPHQIISGSNGSVVLDGLHLMGHLGTKIGCQAALFYSRIGVRTTYTQSFTYFLGIEIHPDPLEVSEIDFEKSIIVAPTIPLICGHDRDCCLTLKINVNETSAVSLLNSCDYKICSPSWDSPIFGSVQIGVVPTRNILLEGSKSFHLALELAIPSGSGTYMDLFQNYRPAPLQVTVIDKTAFKCSMTGDPHIYGFDFKQVYDLYNSGDYIAVVVRERDFMIQIRAVPCGAGAVSCICGIAVREGNNVIKVSKCESQVPSVAIAYELSPGTVIQRSSDGYRLGVYLPSGSEVKIERGGTNIYISIPAFDKELGRGLCGTNDGVEDNDFTHSDGRVDPPSSQRLIPAAFMESWSVGRNESLFEVVPDPVNTTSAVDASSPQYCSCLEKPNGNSTISCSARQYIQRTNTACSGCPVITDALKPSYVVGVGWVRPGANKPDAPFVHPEVKPVDTNKQWPSDQGYTENQARDICLKAIQRSQLFQQCQTQIQLQNSVITDCLADILYGGTTDFLDDITTSFTSQCQLILAKNPDNYVTNTNGGQVMNPDLLDNLCPTECLKHGQCGEKGVCLCQDGWEGDTCLIESGKGPQLVEVKGGAVCDFSKTACHTVNVDVTNINFLDQLQCRVQTVDEQGNSVGPVVMIIAVFLSPDTITLTLPVVGQSTQLYHISATSNGTLFGNELSFRVFDGTCLSCDVAGCTEKKTACHIDKICYKNGEDDKTDGNRTCDISRSTTKWSVKRNEQDHFPVLETSPLLSGPSAQINGSVVFQCEVIYGLDDPDQVFEVVWTFNGQSDPLIPPEILTGHDRITTLSITMLKGHVDQNVDCQVRSYYVGYETNKSPFMVSNTTFFGIQTPPVLTGPIIPNNKSFAFLCEILYDSNDPSQEIEVVWTSNDKQAYVTPVIISGSKRALVLDGALLMGLLDTRVGCQARLIYSRSDVHTKFIRSNTYFAGFQFSPSPLTMSEIDFEKYVTVTSTIPIICEDDQNCCLTFKINMNETSAVSLVNSCDFKMCSYDWDPHKNTSSIQIGVVATRNVLVEGSKGVSLAFDVITLQGVGRYLEVFQNYRPDKLQITVKDETSFKCSLTGDPHIMGFDFMFMYDLYKSGDFIAYVVPERDFMIQVRTVPCGGGSVTCICGIVVRERNDIIKVTDCRNPFSGQTSVDIAYKLSPGTIVERSSDGYRFGIYLPSGSEVKVESGAVNIYISIPAFDKGLGRGLCGTNDGIKDNDFTYPDGKVDPPCTGRCTPDAFLESWRVRGNESLFEVVPDPVNTTDPVYGSSTKYCSCLEKSNGSSTVSCSPRQHLQRTNTACSKCLVITDDLMPSYMVGTGWVRPGTNKTDAPYVHPEVKPVDTNKQWPNDQGVTEAQATDICTKAIQKSQLYPHCQNILHLTSSIISDCLADILFGGTTDFLDDITSTFTAQCQLILAMNPDNYVTNAEGDQVMKPELLDNICPIECLKHGQCRDRGLCHCQVGWEGDTCMIDSGKGPQLVGIKGESSCDTSRSRCDNVHIDVTNINLSETIQCRVQEVDEQGNKVGPEIITTAVFLPPNSITCTLPESSHAVTRYNVSATRDGQLFGNELSYSAFDSSCLECDINGCKEKSSACHISNTCYKNGETDKTDVNKVCDITKSTTDWTLKNSGQTTGTPEPNYPTRPTRPETIKPCHFCFGG